MRKRYPYWHEKLKGHPVTRSQETPELPQRFCENLKRLVICNGSLPIN